MPAFNVEKVKLIRLLGRRIADLGISDVNLLLREAGVNQIDPDEWEENYQGYRPTEETRRSWVIEALHNVDLSVLQGISTTLHELFDEPLIALGASSEPAPLKLFASHLTTQKVFVHEVADALNRKWGVSLFVAHDDIEPDSTWQAPIEDALASVNGGVVFLHPGFIESRWCDQEVGWMLGRQIPLRALKFAGTDPYGPLGKQQAYTVPNTMSATALADVLIDWAAERPLLSGSLITSLVTALQASRNFDQSTALCDRLRDHNDLTTNQVAAVATALRDNDQVYGGEYRGRVIADSRTWLASLIVPWLVQQPGFEPNKDLVVAAAKARGLADALPQAPLPAQPPSAPSDPWNTQPF
ncbi:toll/interleukin-1 receptor domain-containing protein [Herbiconiux daphne]|uniref:Toll/interleukin-1 receptor domain-containing protein n=1 Tax=Herbiconiux daphne TaxID=2970914 RepID=A0ABT2H6V4_9MICO|nr:toll/interleukin-1 receptor domain-containing protein [Herbiconiux daphne]MCS5735666.1 toll/interleukin-1 receptor domain-containing protein [Herbiconiux daphne]